MENNTEVFQQLKSLENSLIAAIDFEETERIFSTYCNGHYLKELISTQLNQIASDQNYTAPYIANKLSLKLIEHNEFTYTIEILLPNSDQKNSLGPDSLNAQKRTIATGNSHSSMKSPTSWKGCKQLLYFQGDGVCKVRKMSVPNNLDINNFKSEVQLTEKENKLVYGGDYLINNNSQDILEVTDVYRTIVLSQLIVKDKTATLSWLFNEKLISIDAVTSQPILARLLSLVNLSIAMEKDLPKSLTETIFKNGDSLLKLRTIEALLFQQSPDAIFYLKEGMASGNKFLSDNSTNLYNRIFSDRSI